MQYGGEHTERQSLSHHHGAFAPGQQTITLVLFWVSTNPIDRLDGEIKRRTEVVGIFPNDDAIARPVGAILLEQNDDGLSSEPAT
jgi:Transposase, Mutator family